jgi:hypothetical protein
MDMTLLRRFGVVVALTLLLTACNGGDGGQSTPSASSTPAATQTAVPTVVPTATPSVEEEVSQGYLRYWDAYSQALLNLDATLVEDVASGERLQLIRDEIEGLRSQGLALRTVVTHNPVILQASESSAVLYDEIVNNSFYVDPQTKDPPVAPGSGEILRDTYYLESTNGQWMVVRSTRQR